MPILVRCPACRKNAEVSRAAIGLQVKCRDCQHVFDVPPGTGYLTVEWGHPKVGERVALTPPQPVTIGRADENDLVLPGARVSRHHTRIVWQDGAWLAQDLDSGNGTFVNGMRIRSVALEHNAGLGIGDFLIRVTIPTARAPGHDTTVVLGHEPGAAAHPAVVHDADARERTVVGAAALPPEPGATSERLPPSGAHTAARPAPRGPTSSRWITALIAVAAVLLAVIVLILILE